MKQLVCRQVAGLCFFWLLVSGAVFGAERDNETISVAVASNFLLPMRVLVDEFEQQTDIEATLSSGSSGKLYAQIKNGAPYQLFFSADQLKPQALEADGLVVEANRYTYALGKLALVKSPHLELRQDPQMLLLDSKFKRIAIANPSVAPYGQAALEVLEAMNISLDQSGQLVRGENISQAYQFVSSGNTELGFVALSQVLSGLDSEVDLKHAADNYWLVPEDFYSPIRQDMVLLEKAKTSPAAKSFYEWIKSDDARDIIRSYGYELAEHERPQVSPQ